MGFIYKDLLIRGGGGGDKNRLGSQKGMSNWKMTTNDNCGFFKILKL
jgi:hypothetical protein